MQIFYDHSRCCAEYKHVRTYVHIIHTHQNYYNGMRIRDSMQVIYLWMPIIIHPHAKKNLISMEPNVGTPIQS